LKVALGRYWCLKVALANPVVGKVDWSNVLFPKKGTVSGMLHRILQRREKTCADATFHVYGSASSYINLLPQSS
jgi:hypothetical protein